MSAADVGTHLWLYLLLSHLPAEQVCAVMGLFALALFIILPESPLSAIKVVLATRNVGSILRHW